MKKIAKAASALLAALLAVWVAATAVITSAEAGDLDSLAAQIQREYILSDDELSETQLSLLEGATGSLEFDGGRELAAEMEYEFSLEVDETGKYWIAAVYAAYEDNAFENQVQVGVNSDVRTVVLPFLWADTRDDLIDRYGNEIQPEQYQLPYSVYYFEDYEDFTRSPIEYELNAGENTITIVPMNQRIKLFALYAVEPHETPDYEEYLAMHSGAEDYSGQAITIQGEYFRAKNDSAIRAASVQNASLTPYSPYGKLLNATDDKANKRIGQELHYEVEVPEDAFYYLSFKFSQPLKTGGLSYRTVEVDGEVPHTGLMDIGFWNTGMNTYENYTAGGDEPVRIYLTAGIHIISIKVTAGPVDEPYHRLIDVIADINETGLTLSRIRGSSSGSDKATDSNRTWDVFQYMPDIIDRTQGWIDELTDIYNELGGLTDGDPSFAADIMLAVQNLERFMSKPREIPNRLSLLNDGSNSAAQLAAKSLLNTYEQNVSFDCMYLHSAEEELPSPSTNIFERADASLRQFLFSFSPIMNESDGVSEDADTLTVWVNKSSAYVETMRRITSEDFTMKTGIDVSFAIMPDEKKVTMANSTGDTPDIALGLSYYRPAEFAMRGMALNLLEFDDFIDWYAEEFNLETLTPMAYEDGIYGAAETLDYYVLFYRKDILDSLGLSVPDTWDDVKAMMPTLLSNAMNFYLPLAKNPSYKGLETFSCFITQNGGDLYTADGCYANFSDPNTLKGLKEMTELYSVYGMAQNVPDFFNAFRSGYIPIGVATSEVYVKLKMSAPELSGLWDIALAPGTVVDGEIRRDQPADTTVAMIFSNTKMKDEAYEFLKWWLSSETQIKYANEMITRYGSDYIWNTANLDAFAQMAYPLAHREIILEQWQYQKEILRHPASYIVERSLSNAWIQIVTEGESFRPMIDEATLVSNREMQRKLTEFGYFDEDGNKVKDYNINVVNDIIAEWEARKGEEQ